MRIILDGMGGDNAPAAVVEGAVIASKEISHEIVIVGKEELINKELKKYKRLQELENQIHVEKMKKMKKNQ